jgi:CubicO group peptidase (beta-lactamase class C family)
MVEGSCDSRFAEVRDEFERNFADRRELGGGVCVTVDGETVVDLWGGVADPATQRPWTSDTLVLVWSCTKGATALCAHLGPSDVFVLGPTAFGHLGLGGSVGFADSAERLSFGYAMSKLGFGTGLNPRGQSLVDATYRALGYRTRQPGVWIR